MVEAAAVERASESAEDQVVNLMQIAESQMKIFGLTSVEGMFNSQLVHYARREALRCRLHWDSRIDDFFHTGGRANRKLDRNPDKL